MLSLVYDNNATRTFTIGAYTIPGGYESRDEFSHAFGRRLQEFECREGNQVLKTLSRTYIVSYNPLVQTKFVRFRTCMGVSPPSPIEWTPAF